MRFVLKTKNTSITFVLFIHSKLFKLNRFEYVFNWIKELRIQFIQTSDQLKRSHWFLIFDCYYFSKFHKIFSLYFHYYIFYSSHGLLLLFCIYQKCDLQLSWSYVCVNILVTYSRIHNQGMFYLYDSLLLNLSCILNTY